MNLYAVNNLGFKNQNTLASVSSFSYGRYYLWYPNIDVDLYYGIAISQTDIKFVCRNASDSASSYSKSLATQEYVNNKITGSINSSY